MPKHRVLGEQKQSSYIHSTADLEEVFTQVCDPEMQVLVVVLYQRSSKATQFFCTLPTRDLIPVYCISIAGIISACLLEINGLVADQETLSQIVGSDYAAQDHTNHRRLSLSPSCDWLKRLIILEGRCGFPVDEGVQCG